MDRLRKEKDIEKQTIESWPHPYDRPEKTGYKNFLTDCLLPHMCQMYNYGFTKEKFTLPTPAIYVSFISQFQINQVYLLKRQDEADVDVGETKWGYYVSAGDGVILRTHEQRLRNSFLHEYAFHEKEEELCEELVTESEIEQKHILPSDTIEGVDDALYTYCSLL